MTLHETEDLSERFDYIIVGAGSAGCMAAAQLTEDAALRVLVLEAGDVPPLGLVRGNPARLTGAVCPCGAPLSRLERSQR